MRKLKQVLKNRVLYPYGYNDRVLPDFIGIGAQKCGTTSLYHYLKLNPSIGFARGEKEVHYFGEKANKLPLGWYKSLFPRRREVKQIKRHYANYRIGEITPYYIFDPYVPAAIKRVMPNVKLIALLRDPVERAYSHYRFNKARKEDGIERLAHVEPTFEAAIKRTHEMEATLRKLFDKKRHNRRVSSKPLLVDSYLLRGHYAEQPARYYSVFDAAQILVLSTEAFQQTPQQTLDDICDFVGADRFEYEPAVFKERYNVSGIENKGLSDEIRQWLVDYYRPHNERLYELLGRDFGWQR